LAFHHAFPRSYAGCSRAGEVAGRSPCPCVLQVDADAMAWLCSLHSSPQTAYVYACVRMSPTYISGSIIDVPPVKPCRRRRHFSPRMRINRFVFLSLPTLQPRRPSRRNGFASIPFMRATSPCQLATGHRRFGSCLLTAEGKAFFFLLLSRQHSSICTPDHPGRGAL
jgi:hypothetical protein